MFLILFGASKIVGYLSKDLYRLAFEYDFVFGFIIAGIGLIFLIRPDSLLMPVCIPLGIVIFGDGVIKFRSRGTLSASASARGGRFLLWRSWP